MAPKINKDNKVWVELLPSAYQALSSIPSTARREKQVPQYFDIYAFSFSGGLVALTGQKTARMG